MSDNTLTYKFSNHIIFISTLLAITISWFFVWKYSPSIPDFMGGDAKDYYSGLISTFITHDLANQTGNDWFLLKTSSGTINVHSIGVSVVLLPFFALAYVCAALFQFPVDGHSLPFQISTAAAALFYTIIGLIYLKKLLQLHVVGDVITAVILLLVFFGTNLLNYTLSEAGMSHVYSFSLISVFLYHSSRFVWERQNKHLLFSFLILGLILLIRPNNLFIIGSMFIWFRSWNECKQFFKDLFRNKMFYSGFVLMLIVLSSQILVWFIQSGSLFHYTYKADGFYWTNPQLLNMLFGFDGGFFIYTPLCFLFLFGLPVIYKQNRFSFYALLILLVVLFYFFSAYWAYTYFDGLGIRVLVDYYALFSFIGAKLFVALAGKPVAYNLLTLVAAFFMFLSLVYTYQANRGILLRAGMTYHKWKYIFLRTGPQYQNCLGGSNELAPYSKEEQKVVLAKEFKLEAPFDYAQKEYGVGLSFDSIGFHSNRIHLKIACSRKELFLNSSKDAIVCMVLEDKVKDSLKTFIQFKLNETPSVECCEKKQYNYTANINADFQPGDKLSLLVWNTAKQAFSVDKFSVQVYNYNYQIN